MSNNQSLVTLLRALRTSADAEDISKLLNSASGLLSLLANPLNVTLLTSQLLSASSIWDSPDILGTSIRVLGVFSSAARNKAHSQGLQSLQTASSGTRALSTDAWISAVIKGADHSSPRWRHLCVIAGLLIGFGRTTVDPVSKSMRRKLDSATIKAANLAMQESKSHNGMALRIVPLILAHVLDLLNDDSKLNLDHTTFLSIATTTAFFSKEGLHSGYLLSTMDSDIVQVDTTRFNWSAKSCTFTQCQASVHNPIFSCLGPLTRLMSLSIASVSDADALSALLIDLVSFTRSMLVQWQQNKLSEIDPAEEQHFLSEASLRHTLPVFWQLLRGALFSTLVLLKAVLSRVLGDLRLPSSLQLSTAIQSLYALRNMYFISSRQAGADFSAYHFVHLTSIDILSQYPLQVETILQELKPSNNSKVSEHPVDRCHDLFYLNTVEQLAPVLTDGLAERHMVAAAMPYLSSGIDARLSEIFEAAHSVMLAVFSVPTNERLLSQHVHPYLDSLLQSFPQALSPRQFRLAIKTLVRVSSPPSQIAATKPMLPSVVLELVRSRLANATTSIVHPVRHQHNFVDTQLHLSEQASFELAMIDSLPFLPIDLLEDWLLIVAESLTFVHDPIQVEICRNRIWEVMTEGEMDVDRASHCFSWWATQGGREAVLGLHLQEGAIGTLHEDSRI